MCLQDFRFNKLTIGSGSGIRILKENKLKSFGVK